MKFLSRKGWNPPLLFSFFERKWGKLKMAGYFTRRENSLKTFCDKSIARCFSYQQRASSIDKSPLHCPLPRVHPIFNQNAIAPVRDRRPRVKPSPKASPVQGEVAGRSEVGGIVKYGNSDPLSQKSKIFASSPWSPRGAFYATASNIFSIKIPYPAVGLFTKTWVTAPMILPF